MTCRPILLSVLVSRGMDRVAMPGWVAGLVAAGAFSLGACAGDSNLTRADAEVVRDSAGIVIVDNRAAAWTAASAWRITRTPELEIGQSDGPAEFQFHSIAGAIRRPDGRLVVADGGVSEIRLYESDGTFVRGVGGPGDGPGEYRLINAIGIGRADTLWVYDFGTRRFTLLDADLQVVRTVTVKGELGALLAVGMTPNGEFVVRESWSSRGQAGDLSPGLRRDSAVIARLDTAGHFRNTIATLPGREVIVSSESGRAVMSAPVVARAANATLASAAVVAGDQSEYEFRVHALDGTPQRIVRWSGVNLRLSRSDLDAAIETRLMDVPDAERPARRVALAAMPHPATRPAYSTLLADDEDNIWAGAWTATGEPPGTWSVFTAEGRYLGDVAMPEAFTPLSWTNGLVVGVWRDDLGVEHLRAYRIARG